MVSPNAVPPKAVPNAVAPSTSNSVMILKVPQLGPYKPMTGSSINPQVGRTPVEGQPSPQPQFGGYATAGSEFSAGSEGAPSVPVNGFLFIPQPIDQHYQNTYQGRNPYGKVNNPPTRGMWTRIQEFPNHIAYNQVTTQTGFKISGPQQRTSVMRNTLPPLGAGYAPETFTPRQQPQAIRFNRIRPSTGSDPYGSGVLNNDTLGAGQTAGGIGGNQYTPQPGPPDTTSTSGTNSTSTETTWG